MQQMCRPDCGTAWAAQAGDYLSAELRGEVVGWLSDFLLATLEQRLKDSVPEASER